VFGASLGELSFVAILLVIVLLAQVAPRIGEMIGARFEAPSDKGPKRAPPPQA
jgi:hypothetical protein